MEILFIKVLNMSISAGWLILAVMLLRLLLGKAPKYIFVLLWGFVGLRLMLPFPLQSVFSLIPSAEVISPSIGYAQHPEINSGVSVIDNAVNPTLGASLAATPMNSANPMQIVLYLGSLIWAAGISLLLLYALISYLRLGRKVAEAVPYKKNTWLCDQVKTPFILGVFRPRIYLPSSLNEEETAYVLAHERAHLRRKDHLWKPLGFFLLIVYWFNPLVWVAYTLLCRDIEAACDEKVISDMTMAEKKAYANALVSCSMQRRLVLGCPLAFGEVGVKERVKGVLNYRKPAFWVIASALIVCAVISVCFLTDPKEDAIVWICRKQCRDLWASFQEQRSPFRECMLEVYRLLCRNQAFYRVVLDIDGPNSFRDFLFGLTEGYYRHLIEQHGAALDGRLGYAITFTTVGTLEMAVRWVHEGCPITPEEMVANQLACTSRDLCAFLDLE